MESEFKAFGRRSSDFDADIFGEVIERSLAKTTCYNLNLPKIGQELLALRVSICACARTVRVLGVRTRSGYFAPTLSVSENWNQRA